jgi:hypothetical protein
MVDAGEAEFTKRYLMDLMSTGNLRLRSNLESNS